MTKRILSILLSVCMVLTLLPTVAFAAETTADFGDFSVTYGDGGTAPTFNSGVLTFTAAGEYTVGMADEKTSTFDVIVVNATGEVKLNLDGVVINAPNGSSAVQDGATALKVTNGTVTLNVIAASSLTGGMGNPSIMEVGNSGAGISGNVTVKGAATLTVTGGKGASSEGGTGGAGGAGISGNVTATEAATLTATGGAAGTGYYNGMAGVGIKGNVVVSDAASLIASSGSGLAGIAISNASRSGGGTITVGEGYTVKVGADASAAAGAQPLPHDQLTTLTSQYIIVTPPSAALPTATQYAAADPAATSGTDYVLDTDNETLTIKTAKGAAWWSANGASYLNYAVKLVADIDVSGFLWTPVGNASPAFTGSFDGQGHSIKGLTVDVASGTDDAYAGLFGCVETASIKNVGLIDAQVSASSSSSAFVGGIAGLGYTGTSIINCYSTGNVSASSSSTEPMGSVNAGGIIGKMIPGTSGAIKNCYSAASVKAEVTGSATAYMGGITGFTTGGSIVDSYYLAGSVPSDKAFNTYSSPTVTGCGTFDTSGALTAGTADQFKSGQTLAYENMLLAALNGWVAITVSTDYYTWAADNGTTPANDGYPVLGRAWAELQAQWGVAGAENAVPGSWAGSGSLTDAMAYANGLASGTAYIQLLTNVDTTATLEFAKNKTTVLDLNGKTLDGDDIPTSSSDNNVLTVNGNLTLCDTSAATVAEQGKITGGHGAGDGTGGGVYINFSGTFIMTGGNITGNTAMNGGGVANEGTFTMTGGSIAGNSCISGSGSVSGGGGVVNLGEFNMSGGSITGNTVASGAGGGVLTEGMTLSGNVNISGNTVGTASDNVALLLYSGHVPNIYITGALTNSTAIGVSVVALSSGVFTPNAGKFTFGEDVVNSDYISKFVSDNSGFAVIADGSQLKLAAAQAITKAAATNGSYTVKVNGNEVPSAIEGQTVTITPTANSGYEVDTISVCKTGETSTTVTVSSNTFTMPAYGVTLSVTFKVSSVPAYTISGTIKGSDTSAGISANLQLKNSGGNVGNVVTAAADGSYSITDVPAGSYTIAVSHAGYDSGTITGVTVSNAAITGMDLTLTKSSTGLTDAQKLAAAQTAIMAAINRMSFSNSTTAADILSVAQAASLYGVTVAWDNTNEFTKTQATSSAKGSIRGALKLTLNQASDGIGIDATIAKLPTSDDNGGGGSNGGGSTTPPSTKPTEPVTGSTENKATVDNKGNASVSLTDKNITDAIADAKAEAAKKGVNAGDITAVIHVTTDGISANTVTVNFPKTTQEQVISNKIASVQLVIDRPDLTIGIDLAAVTEINRQARADVQLSATRMDNSKLSGDAKAAIGNRPAYDLKAIYGSGNSVTDFGKGRVSVEIPYTLQKGELAGNVYAVYVDAEGKVTYLTDSSYDAKRGTVVFSTSHFSTYGVAYKASFNFTDIDGHWAKDHILFVANRGLMTGTSAITFSPNGSMTRGMFVTALGRLANADTGTYKQSSFTDVEADAYYMGYIEWGVKNNILVGIGGGKFNPNGLVTREQMAVIMDKYATAIGFKLPEVHTLNVFADNAKIGAWSAPSVKRIQMAGIIQGKSNNLYDPKGTATRAEVSAVLRRFVDLAILSDTAQGWTMNDSGKWMFYENGKPITGKKDIDGSTYTFDQYGMTADVPKDLRYTTYTVHKGDSFWSISNKLGCPMSELERLNNKSRFSIIFPGDVLKVPEK